MKSGVRKEQGCFVRLCQRRTADAMQGVTVSFISRAPIKVRYGDDEEEIEEGG